MRHLDLFSGIGGFALAARNVWGEDYVNEAFCEIDPYCQRVLKKNFGEESKIYGDIRLLSADTHSLRLQEQGSSKQTDRTRQLNEIDLLTGGFPCQPFSQAGKRKGTNDDRHLWPEMLRVIQEFKPTWVVAENVRGLITISEGLVFEQVCTDLEKAGYDVQAFIVPACSINAPHRRDRLWVIANSRYRNGQRTPVDGEPSRSVLSQKDAAEPKRSDCDEREGDVAYSKSARGEYGRSGRQGDGSQQQQTVFGRNSWNQNWPEVATELCGVDDGLPAELDGFKLSKTGHRVARLKALGNAIVPGIAEEIFKGIRRTENEGD